MISKALNRFYFSIVAKKLTQYPSPTISRKNIYIFPTKHGFQIGLFIILSLIAATIYQINLGLIILVTLSILFFLSILITFENINHLSFHPVESIVSNQNNKGIKIQVTNHTHQKKLTFQISSRDNSLQSSDVNFYAGENTVFLQGLFRQRGRYDFPLLKIETVFPFGIVRAWSWLQLKEPIYVYPAPIQYFKNFNHFLTQTLKNQSNSNEDFDGIDQFQEGMSESKIAWKISNSKNQLYIKKFEKHLNISKILIDYEQIPGTDHEAKLGIMVYLLFDCLQQKKEFAIKIKDVESEYGQTSVHLNKLLKIIAEID
jgi:uncharacterized protein (DUF58 family)